MELHITTFLDILFFITIIVSVFWIASIVFGYGGVVGRSFKMIGWGAILMGASHILEGVSLYFPNHHNNAWVISSHHLLAIIAFVVMAYGFKTLIKSNK